jgi:hypothetical protein
MMVAQSDLFDLIKSLSASEKRYFKLYAAAIGGKEASSYMKLFNFIDKMNSFDDNLIKKKFKNERFIKQLSVLKNYLLNLIIKGLLHSREEAHTSYHLQVQVATIQLLYEKGLHKLCLKTIKRLKEAAQRQEDFSMIDKLCDWEIRILMCDLQTTTAIEIIDGQINSIKKRLTDLEIKREALGLLEVSYETKTNTANNKLLKAAEKFEKKTRVQQNNVGILGKYFYHTGLNVAYGRLNNNDKRLYHATAAMKQVEYNQSFLKANLRLYITLMYNYSNALFSIRKYELLQDFLDEKSNIIEALNDDVHTELKLMGNVILLNVKVLLFINGYYSKLPLNTLSVSKKIIQESRHYSEGFYIAELCTILIHALFLEKQFQEALYFVNEILNHKRYKSIQLFYSQARLWELILHHELNNIILLKSLCESTVRFLSKEKKLMPFDLKMINYLKTDDIEKKETLKEELLKEINKNKENKAVFSLLQDNIDYQRWLTEKKH